MAFETISSNPGTTYQVDNYDTVTLLEGVTMTAPSIAFRETIALTAIDDVTLNILGTVVSGSNAIDFYTGLSVLSSLSNTHVRVGPDGALFSDGLGIMMEDGANNSVTNFGIISSDFRAIYSEGGADSYIENHGMIQSRVTSAIYLVMDFINTNRIVNSGVLSGAGDTANNATILGVGVEIINSGTIIGRDGIAIYVDRPSSLDNSGLIEGAVQSANGYAFNITNAGRITGTVTLSDQADLYRASGDGSALSIQMRAGADTVLGGALADDVSGGADNDSLVGRDGDDTMLGDEGADTLRGGAGDDALYGGIADDDIFGGSSNDVLDGGTGNDRIRGDSGDDEIFGDLGEDTIFGGSGHDRINGGTNADSISGGSGDDFIRGESGSDTISGGAGDDTISASTGHDDVDGGSGNDRIFGSLNDDTLRGTLGDDYLDGGADDDHLFGGSDDDTLIGGTGSDRLSGGTGADTFVFSAVNDSPHGTSGDTITDFETGIDTIDLSGFASTLTFVSTYTGAGNEVRYNAAIGRLYIDIDGGASDFSVDFVGAPALTVDDLIL